jgi:hypothetical protein
MTLARFQSALAELITVPERRRAVRALGAEALQEPELDERERRRLVALARDPRLEVAVMLHVRRRLAGVLTALPHTCRLLGDDAVSSLMDAYGESHPPRSSYFVEEGLAFARFLSVREELGGLATDVLAFETAVLELELERAADRPSAPATSLSPSAYPKLAPRSRLVEIRTDPEQLAGVLSGAEMPEFVAAGRRTLFIQQPAEGGLRVEALDPALARALRLCTGSETVRSLCARHDLDDDDPAALAEGGYIVFAPMPETAQPPRMQGAG